MRKDIIIRRETEDDRPRVEEIVRRAFYNLYIPGAAEHYLVPVSYTHLRAHETKANRGIRQIL